MDAGVFQDQQSLKVFEQIKTENNNKKRMIFDEATLAIKHQANVFPMKFDMCSNYLTGKIISQSDCVSLVRVCVYY